MKNIYLFVFIFASLFLWACNDTSEEIIEEGLKSSQISPLSLADYAFIPCALPTKGSGEGIEFNNNTSNTSNPLLSHQWSLDNQGQKSFAGYSATHQISSTGFWEKGSEKWDLNVDSVYNDLKIKGRGVRVLVTDDSLHCHPDINIDNSLSLDFIDGDTLPELHNAKADQGSHGTSVAGLIGMIDNNGLGGVGVAPQSIISGTNFVSAQGAKERHRVAAFGMTLNGNKVGCAQGNDVIRVVNHSWGSDSESNFSSTLGLTVKNLNVIYYTAALFCKIISVRAAGNSFTRTSKNSVGGVLRCVGIVPKSLQTNDGRPKVGCSETAFQLYTAFPYLINVSAVNGSGVLSSYSTYGAGVWVAGLAGEGGNAKNRVVFNLNTKEAKDLDNYYPAMITADIQGCTSGYSRSSIEPESDILASRNDFQYPWNPPQSGSQSVPIKIHDGNGLDYTTKLVSQLGYSSFAGSPKSSPHSFNPNCSFTSTFNGTSAAAANISGVVALMLEANPELELRDVKHIFAKTSQKVDAADDGIKYLNVEIERGWEKNDAGYDFNVRYGFGLPDAYEAVKMAQSWKEANNRDRLSAKKLVTKTDKFLSNDGSPTWNPNEDQIIEDNKDPLSLNFMPGSQADLQTEGVILNLSAAHEKKGGLSTVMFVLVSPLGTKAVVIRPFNYLTAENTFADNHLYDQPIVINKFYGENPVGEWKLYAYDFEQDKKKISNISADLTVLFN